MYTVQIHLLLCKRISARVSYAHTQFIEMEWMNDRTKWIKPRSVFVVYLHTEEEEDKHTRAYRARGPVYPLSSVFFSRLNFPLFVFNVAYCFGFLFNIFFPFYPIRHKNMIVNIFTKFTVKMKLCNYHSISIKVLMQF